WNFSMSRNALRVGISVRKEGKAPKHHRVTRLRAQALEPRDVPAAALLLDFNTNWSPTAPGYTGVKPVLYSTINHMGWQSLTGISAADRAPANPLTRDAQTGTDGTFLADGLTPGTYDLAVGLGDALVVRDMVTVSAQGQVLAANVTTKAGQILEVRGRITVGS